MIYAFGDVPQFVMFICLHFCKSKQILAGKWPFCVCCSSGTRIRRW
jgi:hypothetical protein